MSAKQASHIGLTEGSYAHTLLVVDDEEAIRFLEVRMLRQFGFNVLEAEGLADAMRLAAITPSIHLLVTDFAMPGANGLELSRQFREIHPDAPILMVSGSFEAICGRAEYPDRFAVLAKPFTREELIDQVWDLLGSAAILDPVGLPGAFQDRR